MDQKSRTRIAVIIACIVVAAVFGSFAYSLFSTRTPPVVLPSLQPDDGPGSTSSSSGDPIQLVEVTTDSVQAVIASLDRAASYHRQFSVRTYWPGGSGTTTVYTWVDDGFTYSRCTLPSGHIRYCLSDGDTMYYWYGSSSTYLTAPADSMSEDLAQYMPSYEDVLDLDPKSICDAGYVAYAGHPCIYVESKTEELAYLERYWVSVESGLLVAAQTLKDDQIVYSMDASGSFQTPCPSNVSFSLPDGTVLHSV